MAKGFWLCAPIPFDKAAGNNPKIATNEAVKTGRNFCTAPRITASVKLWLVLFCLIIDDNRITPFWIETPIAAIKPTPADIEKYVLVKNNASMHPESVTRIVDIAIRTSFLFL